jgi:membrane protease subunit HflK
MPGGSRGPRGNGGDFDQMLPDLPGLNETLERFRGAGPLVPAVIFIVIALLWLASGLYVVEPGEQGVVRRFGREVSKTGQGLNFHWPWPIEQVSIVNVERVRRIEVGFRTVGGTFSRQAGTQARRVAGARSHRVSHESLMLTGDENIVDAQMIVQYRVSEPSRYLFRLKDPERALHGAAEVALRSSVGNSTIDDVLTVGRLQVQEETLEFLQRLMDSYESGIMVTEVKLQTVDPPDQVKDAFAEVVRAREDREKLINQARGYNEDVLPKARGEAQKMLREAEAYREERILRAQGDAARFKALATAYRQSPRVTRDRLHLETAERVLAGSEKVLVDGSIGNGILPFLPLRPTGDLTTGSGSQEVQR